MALLDKFRWSRKRQKKNDESPTPKPEPESPVTPSATSTEAETSEPGPSVSPEAPIEAMEAARQAYEQISGIIDNEPEPQQSDSDEIAISTTKIQLLNMLPESLRMEIDDSTEGAQDNISLPIPNAVEQLKSGRVAVTLKEITNAVPSTWLTAGAEARLEDQIELPLNLVVAAVPPDALMLHHTTPERDAGLDLVPDPFSVEDIEDSKAAQPEAATAEEESQSEPEATPQPAPAPTPASEPVEPEPTLAPAPAVASMPEGRKTPEPEPEPAEKPEPSAMPTPEPEPTPMTAQASVTAPEPEPHSEPEVDAQPEQPEPVAEEVTVAAPTPAPEPLQEPQQPEPTPKPCAAPEPITPPMPTAQPAPVAARVATGPDTPIAPQGSAILLHGVDINSASVVELSKLPHVGPQLAARMATGRPYKTIYDLGSVPGIGRRLFEKLTGQMLPPGGVDVSAIATILGEPDQEMTPLREIATRVAEMRGVRGCILGHEDGHVMAESTSNKKQKIFGAIAPQIYKSVKKYLDLLDVGAPKSLMIAIEPRPIIITRCENIFMIIIMPRSRVSMRRISFFELLCAETVRRLHTSMGGTIDSMKI